MFLFFNDSYFNMSKEIAILILSLIISLEICFFIWIFDKPSTPQPMGLQEYNVSEEPIITKQAMTISPGYFSTFGEVHAVIYSPYINYSKNIKFWMSLNGVDFKEIRILSYSPSKREIENLEKVGYVDLTNINNKIWVKSFIPPQQMLLPSGISEDKFLGSFNGSVLIKPKKTGRELILIFIIFVSLLGVSYGILYTFKDYF